MEIPILNQLKTKIRERRKQNDQYVFEHPSLQSIVDIFEGEWSSHLPEPFDKLKSGHAELFHDPRISWALEKLGGVKNQSVLELGPLEAAHSYMMEQAGANSVLAIESNRRAFMKCLISKEILKLNRTSFLLGDFVKYLRDCKETFDFCLCAGVLYHMQDPIELLELVAKVSQRIHIWTHYYDWEKFDKMGSLRRQVNTKTVTYNGRDIILLKHFYRSALGWKGFCGGNYDYGFWMKQDDILFVLRQNGYKNIEFLETPNPNGPSLSLVASM